jgi:hypothetical protein
MNTQSVTIDQEAIVSATDDQLATIPAIEGLSAKQVRAICRIAHTQDVVISNASDIVEWAQGLLDRDVVEGKRDHSFSLKSVSAAGKHVLNRMSQERAERTAAIRERQETERLTDRQNNRVTQLVKWVRSLEFTKDSFEADCQKATLAEAMPIVLSGKISKAQASDTIELVERFAALVGVELPNSVNAPSAEGDTVATAGEPTSTEEESAF